mmetsp:Transcript_29090/g.65941  ORF Transcript_29090/g.65941 Transcript_29090/m.65941 type:complete len:264 (+) Transcript_29090:319-1110(+)
MKLTPRHQPVSVGVYRVEGMPDPLCRHPQSLQRQHNLVGVKHSIPVLVKLVERRVDPLERVQPRLPRARLPRLVFFGLAPRRCMDPIPVELLEAAACSYLLPDLDVPQDIIHAQVCLLVGQLWPLQAATALPARACPDSLAPILKLSSTSRLLMVMLMMPIILVVVAMMMMATMIRVVSSQQLVRHFELRLADAMVLVNIQSRKHLFHVFLSRPDHLQRIPSLLEAQVTIVVSVAVVEHLRQVLRIYPQACILLLVQLAQALR